MTLPKPYKNVMITYTTNVHVNDKYYGHNEVKKVTRRAFYCDSSGYFSVPQEWGTFTFSDGTRALLPQGFCSYPRVSPNSIESWVYCDEGDDYVQE